MNFNTLKYVITVAEERSFTRAAQRLYISQPSLSQNVLALENRLGTPLFDRKSIPLQLTYAGKVYVEWAQQVLLSESQMNRRLECITEDPRIQLCVGIAPHRSALMIPKLAGIITSEYPNCSLIVEDSMVEDKLYDKLHRRELDIVIGDAHSDTARFTSRFVVRERLLLAVPKAYGIQGTPPKNGVKDYPSIHLVELKDKPFILTSPSSFLRMSLQTLCEQEEFTPICNIECHNVATAHSITDRGFGSTLVPELLIRCGKPKPNVDYFAIAKGTPHRSVNIVYRNGDHLMEPAKHFIELFIQEHKAL